MSYNTPIGLSLLCLQRVFMYCTTSRAHHFSNVEGGESLPDLLMSFYKLLVENPPEAKNIHINQLYLL